MNLLVGLLNPPTKRTCKSAGILNAKRPAAASARGTPEGAGRGGLLSGLGSRVFGQAPSPRGGSRSRRSRGRRAEMQKRAPTLGNLLVIILFALSCFGLLLFLWESFGGPLPLKPKGYRFTVAFPRTLALAEQSDVRISGVDVGHVVALKLGNEGRTDATIEIAGQYAPIRANTHAILRQKTLLGETYVQLIPEGQSGSASCATGASSPTARSNRSSRSTTSSPRSIRKTRRNFQAWLRYQAAAIAGRGEQINASLSPTLEPFVEHANSWSSILASQEGAVRALVHNTGVVFNALAGRDHQLEGLIVNGERTFHAAAEEQPGVRRSLPRAAALRAQLDASRCEALDRFAVDRQPVPRRIPPGRAPALARCCRPPSRSRRSSTASSPRSGR